MFLHYNYYHDSCNKPQRTREQIMFQQKLTIYRLNYKNAFSDEEEPKKREREWERNEERDRKKKVKKI